MGQKRTRHLRDPRVEHIPNPSQQHLNYIFRCVREQDASWDDLAQSRFNMLFEIHHHAVRYQNDLVMKLVVS